MRSVPSTRQQVRIRIIGKRRGALLVMVAAMLACGAPVATTAPVPTIELETMVASTAHVAQTQTQELIPTSSPTYLPSVTPFPSATGATATPTPNLIPPSQTITLTLIATITPSPTLPSFVLGANTSTPRSSRKGEQTSTKFPKTPVPWDCTVVSKDPPNGTSVHAKARLTISWGIRNKGTKTWTPNTIDVVYAAGFTNDEQHLQDLNATVPPGAGVTVRVTFTVSKFPGPYTTYWALRVGSTKFCQMKYQFEVN